MAKCDVRGIGSGGRARNRAIEALREEVVTKDDGRYLIYYSWPQAEADQAPGAVEHDGDASRPPQRPWSPEAGPSDV